VLEGAAAHGVPSTGTSADSVRPAAPDGAACPATSTSSASAASTRGSYTAAARLQRLQRLQVRVVTARGSGDDEIVRQVGDLTGPGIVVTADRALRARCEAVGASVTGPRWLLDLL
jgi:hypothetical protein